MKLQYLGDWKDSFKWDHHDFLVSELRYPLLNVVLMLTADDDGGHGRTKAESFPARTSVLTFCRDLQDRRDDQMVFIDPDNGCREMHVGYRDIAQVLTQVNENSIVSVFHHFRRISFPEDYAQIKAGLNGTFSTAIYWLR